MESSIREAIRAVLKKLDIDYNDEIIIETPKQKEHGDFSTNISMKLASVLKSSPMDIAKRIVAEINHDKITKAEIKMPGFINFFVKKDYLLDNLKNILKLGADYGKGTPKSIKVNVEFTSANPTGLLHVGHIRGTTYGDNLCRILKFAGYDVTPEYYFNDGGVQIEKLGKSLQIRYKQACGQEIPMFEDGYHGIEITDIAKELYNEYKDSLLDKESSYFGEIAKAKFMEEIKKILTEFGVKFDIWTSEQKFRDSDVIEKTLKQLEAGDNIYISEGATWLKSTKYGDDKDRVLVKSDGNYTYLVPDISYHLDKISRGYDLIVDVLGADHHSYVTRLKASIEALGFASEKIRIKILQMVRLLKDGEEIKLSKRTGQTVTMQELIDEVGVNAVRYFFASRSLDTQLDFDMGLAVKNTNENPVYYVSYAYARICSILRDYKISQTNDSFEHINDEKAYNVFEKLYNFPMIVEDAAVKEMPHLVTNYIYELASSFHSLYNEYRFVCDDENLTNENLKMLLAIKITMENALNLIGIIPPERM